MLFSFIVPVYNAKNYLDECVNSILRQNFKNFEVLLIDDGSTDGSGDLCDEYARVDEHIRVIHKRNGGQTSARKEGVLNANGMYVVPVDADDWVDNGLLNRLNRVIEQYSPDIISFGMCRVKKSGECISIKDSLEAGYYDRKSIVESIFPKLIRSEAGEKFAPCLCGKAIKKELYEKYQLKINERIRISEDLVVTYSCVCNANSLYILDKLGYFYRDNIMSITHQKKAYPWNEVQMITDTMIENMKNDEYCFNEQIRRYYCHRLFTTAVSCFRVEKKYFPVRQEVLGQISKAENRYYIVNAKYNRWTKDAFAQFVLRYKLIFFIKLYAILEDYI